MKQIAIIIQLVIIQELLLKKNSKPIAVITNDDCEVADGFRVRLKPVYPN